MKNILSIAGSDPSGGAGIQADLKTFTALGCYGMAVVTALTAQNTQGVRSSVSVPERFMRDQLDAVFEDVRVDAVKIGMLGNDDIMHVVADSLEKYQPKHIVLDPVMVATSGDMLMDMNALQVLKKRLIPLATVITPNIPEAEKLLRSAVLDMDVAGERLLNLGAKAALLKGGHLKGDIMRDVLADSNGLHAFEAPRVDTMNTHGTGCTLSSALAVYLGVGCCLVDACRYAKDYLTQSLLGADKLDVGHGHGPVNHVWMCYDKKFR